MTMNLKWRLGKLPTVEELLQLINNKLITQEEAKTMLFSSEKEVDVKKLDSIGEVKDIDGLHVSIHVPRDEAPKRAAKLLSKFPVADLTIEEPPIEEIIRKVFTKAES